MRVRGKNKKGNTTFARNEWESEMPHAHPQPLKRIYVLNIIIQNISEKRRSEGNGPQKNSQNPNAFNWGI
jgi:hypothetical protein